MSNPQPIPRKPLRIWPGIAFVVVQWLAWFVVPRLFPDAAFFAVMAGAVCGLAIIAWWLFFSRAPWLERIGAIVLIVVAVIATKRVVHPSIAGGMMGMMMPIYSIPVMSLALVVWATVTRGFSNGVRRALLVVAVLLGCGVFMLIRTGGITANAVSDLHWRWTKSPEELLLTANDEPPASPSTPLTSAATGTGLEWPGFRGANRDGVVRGVSIDTNWTQKPPVAIWRKPVGPGWSSFAVRDNFVYTQEQRGESEVVSCYNLANGQPVWRHRDAARFYESNAGAGPRGTPTLSNGRVYTLGATGILNVLDASNGSVIWSRNAATDTKKKTPGWGFSGSPLVVGDIVIVAASGALAAYDIANGNPRWMGPEGGTGYSSPHLMTINGVDQVLFMNGEGVISVAPADGKLLWKHAWTSDSIVQPAVTADGDVLIGSGSGMATGVGLMRIGLENGPGGWTAKERWLSDGLNPYFNDFVVHKDYAYGFDNNVIVCVDLKNNGALKWEGGNYGHGQLVVLSDQDLLLVLSEAGELALVKATPDRFTELAKFKAIEGKTWNHPVVVGDTVLVRNSEEMAAYKLPTNAGK